MASVLRGLTRERPMVATKGGHWRDGAFPEAALTVASRRGVSIHRVLLAWLREQSPNIMPLVGASRPASIRDSAVPLDLTDQDLETLRADLG